MPHSLQVLGISGSLRQDSYNRALLQEAARIAPEGMEIEIFDQLGEIPPFNEDVEAEGYPAPVQPLQRAIAEADALLIATPEYNYSTTGVLKNAIDWASRPEGESPLEGKPTALMGASPGMGGTARAQLALRQTFVFTKTPVLPGPEVLDASAGSGSMTTDGSLTTRRASSSRTCSYAWGTSLRSCATVTSKAAGRRRPQTFAHRIEVAAIPVRDERGRTRSRTRSRPPWPGSRAVPVTARSVFRSAVHTRVRAWRAPVQVGVRSAQRQHFRWSRGTTGSAVS